MTNPFKNHAVQQVHDMQRGSGAWYQSLINGYLDERDKIAKPFWDLARECYEQEQFSGYRLETKYILNQVQPPRVYGLVHQIESQVFNRAPKFFVQPMTGQQEDLARFAESALNTEWLREARLQREARLCVRDTIFTGWGFMLSGVEGDRDAFARERAKRTKLARQIKGDPMAQALVGELTLQAERNKDSVTAADTETSYEMDDRVWHGRVCSRRVSPNDIVIDPSATSLDDARWIGRVIYADYESVMQNEIFKNKKGLAPTAVLSSSRDRTRTAASSSPNKEMAFAGGIYKGPNNAKSNTPGTGTPYEYIEIYELFVRQADGTWDMKVFAKNHNQFLREEKSPYDLGCPYKMLRWNDIGERIFAVSDVQPILTHIIEEREIRTRMHDSFMRAAVDVYGFNKSILNEEDIQAFTADGIGLMVPLNLASGQSLNEAIQLLPRNTQTQEAMAYLSVIERNIQDGTGLGANQQLQALKSETSATEAAEIARNAGVRGAAKFSAFNDFIGSIAHDRLKLAAQFYDPGMISLLAGPEAAAMWIKEEFTHADIQWGLNVSVEVGSMQPRNDQTRAQAVTTALSIARQDPVAAQRLNMPALWEEFFKLLGFQDGSRFLLDQDPQQAAADYMKMALMQGGGGMGGGAPPAAPPAMASGDAGMAQMGGGQLG